MFFQGFGWGQPTRTSQVNYTDKRRGNLITYISPIVVSLVLAAVCKYAMRLLIVFYAGAVWQDTVNLFLAFLMNYFALIAVINIIPVYPMCGNRIIRCFLTPNAQIRYSQNEKMYQMILIFLLLLGVISPIISKVTSFVLNIL
jgi:Zn-dependent protease